MRVPSHGFLGRITEIFREVLPALRACVVTFAMCAVAYPSILWGLAELVFPVQAGGELNLRPGRSNGRRLGKSSPTSFDSDRYFHPPPPSAADYRTASAASGSNLGTKILTCEN